MTGAGESNAAGIAPVTVPRERLDALAPVIDPLGWLTLWVSLALLAGGLSWSVLGSLPITVHGEGLLLPENSASVEIRAPKLGWLRRIAKVNDRVTAGEVIAVLDPAEANRQRTDLAGQLAALKTQRREATASFGRRIATQSATGHERRRTLSAFVAESRAATADAQQVLTRAEAYLARGLITLDRVEVAKQRLFGLRESLTRAEADLAGVDADALAINSQRGSELRALDTSIAQAEARLSELNAAIGLATRIVSPADGVVVASFANEGQLIDGQQSLLIMRSGDRPMQAVIFVALDRGKEIKPGMTARVSVSTAQSEVYGSLLGDVVWVSSGARSEAELARTLGQSDLARRFTSGAEPIEVHVRLRRSAASANGYVWSSPAGTGVPLSAGMIARGTVVTRREPPLAVAAPALRKLLGEP